MKSTIQKIYSTEHHNIFHFTFKNFTQMQEYGKNWEFYDQFRFGTQTFYGQYDIYMDEQIQVANSIYHDGLMYRGYAPKDCLTLTLILDKHGSLSANKKILEGSEILILDDTKEFEIAFSDYLQKGVVSINKKFVDTHFPYLHQMVGNAYKDTNDALKTLILNMQKKTDIDQKTIQSTVIQSIQSLSLETQKAIPKKLSKKESSIFNIRDYIIVHAQDKLSIEELAIKFDMSEKTMQTAFKKLFGYTPKKFFKLLKFNLAYRDLIKNDEEISIGEIAMKYEFTNFGLFSHEFKEIFGLLPSEIRGGEI